MTAAAKLSAWLPSEAAQAMMNASRFIRVSGPDAASFLQGQFSNDIQALEENPAQFSSYNSPKGRVLAFLRILRHEDDFLLAVDEAIADTCLQRLRMFVLRSNVVIETDETVRGVVVTGGTARETLMAAGLPAPEPGCAAPHDSLIIFAVPGPEARFEIFSSTLPALDVPVAAADDLSRWDILFRLPRMLLENQDRHVAQHLGLDERGAISFKKGCYTGQEIIARMKYLGKVKKGAVVFAGENAKPGDSIRNQEDRSVGEVVNVADANGGQLILASVNIDDPSRILHVNDVPLTPVSG